MLRWWDGGARMKRASARENRLPRGTSRQLSRSIHAEGDPCAFACSSSAHCILVIGRDLCCWCYRLLCLRIFVDLWLARSLVVCSGPVPVSRRHPQKQQVCRESWEGLYRLGCGHVFSCYSLWYYAECKISFYILSTAVHSQNSPLIA